MLRFLTNKSLEQQNKDFFICFTMIKNKTKKHNNNKKPQTFQLPLTHLTLVFVHFIRDKGSDASWKNDEEPPPEYIDYSDDEQERMAKNKRQEGKEGRRRKKPQRR